MKRTGVDGYGRRSRAKNTRKHIAPSAKVCWTDDVATPTDIELINTGQRYGGMASTPAAQKPCCSAGPTKSFPVPSFASWQGSA